MLQSLEALVAWLTLLLMTSPLWGGGWLVVRARRRRKAAAAALAAAWATAEQIAQWEAVQRGPFGDHADGISASISVVQVARLQREERRVGLPTTVATLRARLTEPGEPAQFRLDIAQAMDRARQIADDLNATRYI